MDYSANSSMFFNLNIDLFRLVRQIIRHPDTSKCFDQGLFSVDNRLNKDIVYKTNDIVDETNHTVVNESTGI